jgi:putative membrane protein
MPTLLVGLVAIIHVAIAGVEMFLWKRPRIHQRLAFSHADAMKVAPIVANAGLYNAFLAAGLIWTLAIRPAEPVMTFFLVCVVAAGLFGAVTLKWTTLVLQTLPATLALAAIYLRN